MPFWCKRSRYLRTYNKNQRSSATKTKGRQFSWKIQISKIQKGTSTLFWIIKLLSKPHSQIGRKTHSVFPSIQNKRCASQCSDQPWHIEKFRKMNGALDRCCQLALRQPLLGKQLLLMTAASFQAAGWLCSVNRRRYKPEIHINTENFSSYSLSFKNIHTISNQNIHLRNYAKTFIAICLAFEQFNKIFGWDLTSDYHDRQQISHQILRDKKRFFHPYGMPAISYCIIILPFHTFHEKWTLQQIFYFAQECTSREKYSWKSEKIFPQNRWRWTLKSPGREERSIAAKVFAAAAFEPLPASIGGFCAGWRRCRASLLGVWGEILTSSFLSTFDASFLFLYALVRSALIFDLTWKSTPSQRSKHGWIVLSPNTLKNSTHDEIDSALVKIFCSAQLLNK